MLKSIKLRVCAQWDVANALAGVLAKELAPRSGRLPRARRIEPTASRARGRGPTAPPRAEPERSPSGARAEPERSPSGARAEPERSPSGARAEPERSERAGDIISTNIIIIIVDYYCQTFNYIIIIIIIISSSIIIILADLAHPGQGPCRAGPEPATQGIASPSHCRTQHSLRTRSCPCAHVGDAVQQ